MFSIAKDEGESPLIFSMGETHGFGKKKGRRGHD